MSSRSPVPLNKRHEIAAAILSNTAKSYKQLSIEFGVCSELVYRIAKQFGIRRPRGRKKQVPRG